MGQMMWFELKVVTEGKLPLRDVFRARSLQEAIFVAQRRFPKAVIEVPEGEQKTELARSKNGPKKRQSELKSLMRYGV